jgi:hypothetical protein
MAQDSKKYCNSELQIDEVSTTSEKLSGRAGMALFIAYLHSIEIFHKLTGFSVPFLLIFFEEYLACGRTYMRIHQKLK